MTISSDICGDGFRSLDLAAVALAVINRQRGNPVTRFTRKSCADHRIEPTRQEHNGDWPGVGLLRCHAIGLAAVMIEGNGFTAGSATLGAARGKCQWQPRRSIVAEMSDQAEI